MSSSGLSIHPNTAVGIDRQGVFMLLRVLLAIGFLSFSLGQATAQDRNELDKLDEKFSRYFEKAMPGWKHERVEPAVPTENVLIQFWSASGRKVKMSIMPHSSAAEARTALQNFLKYEGDKETLNNHGDEAYAWGYGHSRIVIRKGRYLLFISSTATIGLRPEERMLSDSDRFELMKSEMRRWTRAFSDHAKKAIEDQ